VLQRFPRRIRPRSAVVHRARDGKGRCPTILKSQVKGRRCSSMPATSTQIAGVADAIAAISLPKCVASRVPPKKIQHGLDCANLHRSAGPAHLFGNPGQARPSPPPDLFCLRAKQMRARPGRCLVNRGQRSGVTGARAAGMPVLVSTAAAIVSRATPNWLRDCRGDCDVLTICGNCQNWSAQIAQKPAVIADFRPLGYI